MRQTNFSLDEILHLLSRKDEEYPSCLLVNEIGMICSEWRDEVSEKSLLSILEDENPFHRILSCGFLSTIPEMADKHSIQLAKFRIKPENQQYLKEIDEEIKREIKRLRFPMVRIRY